MRQILLLLLLCFTNNLQASDLAQDLLNTKPIPTTKQIPNILLQQDLRGLVDPEGLYRISTTLITETLSQVQWINRIINAKISLNVTDLIEQKTETKATDTQVTQQTKQENKLSLLVVRNGIKPAFNMLTTRKDFEVFYSPLDKNLKINFTSNNIIISYNQTKLFGNYNLNIIYKL